MIHCKRCSHPTICDTHGCAAEEARANKAKRSANGTTAAEDLHLLAMFRAWHELRGLGWIEMLGYPTDGTVVEVITAGSTGVHDAKVMDGSWWVIHANDLWPAHPFLWRPKRERS